MTIDEFITKWAGQTVDTDGVYPNQCMDLMHQYVYDVVGQTDKLLLAAPSAAQVYTGFKPEWATYFDKIDNTPSGIPQKGDILFFGTLIGPYGHVCIFHDGDANSFNSFDANWPTGSLPHIQNHSYNGVLGWLHPKDATMNISQALFNTLVTKATGKDAFTAKGYLSPEDVDKKIQSLQDDNQSKEKTIESLQADNDSQHNQIVDLQAKLTACLNSKPVQPPTVTHTYADADILWDRVLGLPARVIRLNE